MIKGNKIPFEKLKPRNQSGQFLMDEKNEQKNIQSSLQQIIDNFPKTESIIKKYISDFKSDNKKKEFLKNRVLY